MKKFLSLFLALSICITGFVFTTTALVPEPDMVAPCTVCSHSDSDYETRYNYVFRAATFTHCSTSYDLYSFSQCRICGSIEGSMHYENTTLYPHTYTDSSDQICNHCNFNKANGTWPKN